MKLQDLERKSQNLWQVRYAEVFRETSAILIINTGLSDKEIEDKVTTLVQSE